MTPPEFSLRMYNYLESPKISEALASAEVIAAGVTDDLSIIPSKAKNWLNKKQGFIKKKPHIKKEHAILAMEVVEKIANDSKLKELWLSTNDYADWQVTQQVLISKLKKI